MKYAILGLLLIVILPTGAQAMWAMIELDELVQDSDLIVVGTLRDVSEYTKERIDYASGNITVDEVIWGNLNVGDNLTLSWQNPSRLVCPRVEHKGNDNIKAIWLLTTDDHVNVKANAPEALGKLASGAATGMRSAHTSGALKGRRTRVPTPCPFRAKTLSLATSCGVATG